MSWITIKYLDLKIVDGSTPSKKRVVFFDRRTDTKLLTISAAEISNDGILETTLLDTDLPDRSIYAIAFDDEGNRQLAGADKLSIKTKQIWLDRNVLFYMKFEVGKYPTELISGAILRIDGSKSSETVIANDVATTFGVSEPTIGDCGLYISALVKNWFKNSGITVNGLSVVSRPQMKGIPVTGLRESGTGSVVHNFSIPLDAIPGYYFDIPVYVTLSKYIRVYDNINRDCYKAGITIYVRDAYDQNIELLGSLTIDLRNKTVTAQSLPNVVAYTIIDPEFPDCFLLVYKLVIPANKELKRESWSISERTGVTSYTADTSCGIDIFAIQYNKMPGTTNMIIPVTGTTRVGLLTSCNKYYIKQSELASNFKQVFYGSMNSQGVLNQRLNLYYKIRFNVLHDWKTVTSNKVIPLIVNTKGLFEYQPSEYTKYKFNTTIILDDKNTALVVSTADIGIDMFDMVRVEFISGDYNRIPNSIITKYNIPTNNYGCCFLKITNETKGTSVIVSSFSFWQIPLLTTIADKGLTFGDSVYLDEVTTLGIDEVEIVESPLITDWEKFL